ncbi:MAG TPA: exodeoxyribonuclease VII small subunit [Bacillales bacterium]|nr:exodeoxyribonuclease VII small subunit [Bacillales bacterium]
MTEKDNRSELTGDELSFEEAMERMEKTVHRLEEGDVPLEEAIELFQEGMRLSKICHQKLQHVEKKMDQILQEDGEMKAFFIQEDDQA